MEITLEEVLKEKDIVLVDGSTNGHSNFYWYLGGIDKPIQIDLSRVEEEIFRVNQFSELLLKPNVRTIPQVTEELSCLKDMVEKNKKHIFYKARVNCEEERLKLDELSEAIFRMTSYSKGREISKTEAGVLNGNLEKLFEIVSILSEELHLKRDSNLKYGRSHPKDWKDKKTDEYLVAFAYSLMLQNKKSAILTGDTDLIRLMGVCTKIIGCEEFLPTNQVFRESVLKNSYGVYFRTVDQKTNDLFLEYYQQSIDLSKTSFDKSFQLYNQPNKTIKSRISSLIKEIKYQE